MNIIINPESEEPKIITGVHLARLPEEVLKSHGHDPESVDYEVKKSRIEELEDRLAKLDDDE